MSDKTRFFKLMNEDGSTTGRYAGKRPRQAASKAFTNMMKEKHKTGNTTEGEFEMKLVECTRGSACKVYSYVGERVKLDKPETMNIAGQEITYNYRNKILKNKKKDQ